MRDLINQSPIPNIKIVILTQTHVGKASKYVWACATKNDPCVNTQVNVNEYIKPASSATHKMNFNVDAIIAFG